MGSSSGSWACAPTGRVRRRAPARRSPHGLRVVMWPPLWEMGPLKPSVCRRAVPNRRERRGSHGECGRRNAAGTLQCAGLGGRPPNCCRGCRSRPRFWAECPRRPRRRRAATTYTALVARAGHRPALETRVDRRGEGQHRPRTAVRRAPGAGGHRVRRLSGRHHPLPDAGCPVPPCVLDRGLPDRGECPETPCERLEKRWVSRAEMEERLGHAIPEDDFRRHVLPFENAPYFTARGRAIHRHAPGRREPTGG
jgi:hypothetical protein